MRGSSGLTIREPIAGDFPAIQDLIVESFIALADYHGDIYRDYYKKIALESEDMIDADAFMKTFGDSSPYNKFWVLENEDSSGLAGCVGLKRKTIGDWELVRMAVDSSLRGKGLGTKLINVAILFCKEIRASRVTLITANPSAGRFYSANRFQTKHYGTFTRKIEGLPDVLGQFYSMVYYIGASIVRKVAVVGGTHGNERLGVELIKQWLTDGSELKRPTFTCTPMFGNPTAVAANQRFIDIDLNRQFPLKTLNSAIHRVATTTTTTTSASSADSKIIDTGSSSVVDVGQKRKTLSTELSQKRKSGGGRRNSRGGTRSTSEATTTADTTADTTTTADTAAAAALNEDFCAARLNELLGPKTVYYVQPTAADFVIDLHSSTANVGLVIILGHAGDGGLGSHVAQHLQSNVKVATKSPTRIASVDLPRHEFFGLDSLAPQGLTIEVGPLAHGTLNATLLEDTRRLVLGALDYLEQRNQVILQEAHTNLMQMNNMLSAPSNELKIAGQNLSSTVIDDLTAAELAPFQHIDISSCTYVPTALAPDAIIPSEFPEIYYYHMFAKLKFPRVTAGGDAAAVTNQASSSSSSSSSSIAPSPQNESAEPPAANKGIAGGADAAATTTTTTTSSSSGTSNNHHHHLLVSALLQLESSPPRKYVLHTSLDHADWVPLKDGVPLFQAVDGSDQVIPFSRSAHISPLEKDDIDVQIYPMFINEAAYQGDSTAFWVTKEGRTKLF